MGTAETSDDAACDRLMWIERVDALLARAEVLTGRARADDAPLSERISLWVEIIAVRQRIAAERRALNAFAGR